MKSKLTFERKKLRKDQKYSSSRDRKYIDFIIDGVPLSELLGGVGYNIGKFGWGNNIKFELSELEDFKTAHKSRLDNGLFSIYVCPECGDEGCGAIMFEIKMTESTVIWDNFVWGDGYHESEENPHERIDIKPIIFNKNEYYTSISELERMIIDR